LNKYGDLGIYEPAPTEAARWRLRGFADGRSGGLGAISLVLAGSVLAALPLGFGFLVAGRGLQGVGLGLVPLAIATARDVLSPERSRPAVALLSSTSVAGVGLGYLSVNSER
jgi:MFS family permease